MEALTELPASNCMGASISGVAPSPPALPGNKRTPPTQQPLTITYHMPDCGECKEQLQAPAMFTLMACLVVKALLGHGVSLLGKEWPGCMTMTVTSEQEL